MSAQSVFELIKTVGAYILLFLVLLVGWAVISPIAYGLRWALGLLKAPETLSRLVAWLITLTPVRLWQTGWNLLGERMTELQGELRLVVDQRIARLERALKSFREQFRDAAAMLRGLGVGNGPASLVQDMKNIRDEIGSLGRSDDDSYEIEPDYEKATASEISARIAFFVLLFLSLLVVVVNGYILSEAFRSMGFSQVLGGFLPVGLAFAIMYVFMEFGMGFFVHLGIAHRDGGSGWANTLLLAALLLIIGALILVEVSITNLIGNSQIGQGTELTALMLDQLSLDGLTFLGVLGFAIGSFNILAGYFTHMLSDKRTHLAARRRIVRDAKAWNQLLTGLPGRLEGISLTANRSEAALQAYFEAMGNKGESLSGTVGALTRERDEVNAALKEADLRSWPEWIGSDEGDRQRSHWVSIGFSIVTLVIGIFFIASFGSEISDGIADISLLFSYAGAAGVAVAIFLFGHFSFAGIQLIEHPYHRTMPLRPGVPEIVFSVLGAAFAVSAVLGVSLYAHGTSGFPAGAVNLVLAAALAWLGSQWDRVWYGFFVGGAGFVQMILATAFLVGGVLLHLIGWVLIALGKIVLFVLNFLALPTDLVVRWYERRKARLDGAAR